MATTAISAFKTALGGGGARPSLFDISVDIPAGLTALLGAGLTNQSVYKCNISEIPGLTVTPIERQYFGRTVKIPGDITFAGTFSTTFINTEDFSIHTALNSWMALLNPDDNTSYATGTPQQTGSGWAGSVTLTQYKKDGKAGIKYIYEDCWPNNVSAIELAYDSASTIEEFTVTWEYNYFTVDNGSNVSIIA
tara:strand:+ start:38 stop:616 length:579 start_codon:yes stop_codon:yes gene_type:complete